MFITTTRAIGKAANLPEFPGAEYTKNYAQVNQVEIEAFVGEAFSREFDWYL